MPGEGLQEPRHPAHERIELRIRPHSRLRQKLLDLEIAAVEEMRMGVDRNRGRWVGDGGIAWTECDQLSEQRGGRQCCCKSCHEGTAARIVSHDFSFLDVVLNTAGSRPDLRSTRTTGQTGSSFPDRGPIESP